MDAKGISRLEALVQQMVEGSFGRLFGGQLEPLDVASRLVWAMEDSTRKGATAAAFEVALNPRDLAQLETKGRALEAALAQAAWDLARQAGLPLASKPAIRVVPDELVRRHTVQINAVPDQGGPLAKLEGTQVINQQTAREQALAEIAATDAFLIVQGRRHYPLLQPLTTLGRRTDNDIVLDLPAVSRQHAQIRWRFGRFILYDVSNRGRTSVNGVPVTEHVLQPGDVIALSEAMLIYAEGQGPGADVPGLLDDGTKTQLRPPSRHE